MGHSVGEYAALVASGVLSFEEAMRLVDMRARLMSQCRVPADAGMAVLTLSSSTSLSQFLQRYQEAAVGLQVDLAGINSSRQVVLSGLAGDIARVTMAMDGLVARSTRLSGVSHPFHSRFMLPAASQFAKALPAMVPRFREPKGRLISNVTGLPATAPELPVLLSRQIHSPVRWWDGVQWALQHSPRFVEVGPGRVLSGLLRQERIISKDSMSEGNMSEGNILSPSAP